MKKVGFMALFAMGLLFYASCGSDDESVFVSRSTDGDSTAVSSNSSASGMSYATVSSASDSDKNLGGPKMGSMVDPRDGNTYQTIKVGSLVWMAENLRYSDTLIYTPYDSVWRFDFDTRESYIGRVYDFTCDVTSIFYGCTYTYDMAMDYTAYQADSFNVGICPPGWHIPSLEEFQTYAKNVKTEKVSLDNYGNPAEFWSDRSTDDGLTIEGIENRVIQADSERAVSFWVSNISRSAGDGITYSIQAKSKMFHVRCVQGAPADSTVMYARYMQRVQDTLLALSSSAEYQRYLSSSSDVELAEQLALLSSSAAIVRARQLEGVKRFFNKDLEYHYFTDPRDSMVYGFLPIAGHEWMAENLRYLPDKPEYENYIEKMEKKYDPYYYYESGTCYKREDVATACPEGWHAATAAEWDELMNSIDSLGEIQSTSWTSSATNSTGFTMIPESRQTEMMMIFSSAYFWTSTDTISKTPKVDTLGTKEEPVYDTTYVDYPCNIWWFYSPVGASFQRGCGGDNTCARIRCVNDL